MVLPVILVCSLTHAEPAVQQAPAVAEPHAACADPFVSALAEGARHWANAELDGQSYGTGSELFDQEWLFGTWMMAAVGLGQHARLCPDAAGKDMSAMEAAIARMVSPGGRSFDASKWGSDIEERLEGERGSMALLGYGGLALALHSALEPEGRFAATEQAWMDALARRLGPAFVETYPGERYPVDNAAGIAALSLHQRSSGQECSAEVTAALEAMRGVRDPTSGLLIQAVGADGAARDAPRGSGTFLSAWFLQRADPDLARELYESGRDVLGGSLLGIRAMREYPPGQQGRGDIDSGPLIMGYSVSATGFALGGASAFGDEATRDGILWTVRLGGALAVRTVPGLAADQEGGATGSHLGDAILLAMLTAEGMP